MTPFTLHSHVLTPPSNGPRVSTQIVLRALALSVSVAFASIAGAQGQIHLENTSTGCKYTLEWNTGDQVWLSNGILNGDQVDFRQTDLFDIAIRDGSNTSELLRVHPGDLSLIAPHYLSPPPGVAVRVGMAWTGNIPDGSASGVDLRVDSFWQIRTDNDYLEAAIKFEILNPLATTYRPLNVRFPRLDINCLDPVHHGDLLATGARGGLLYGDPIHWQDPDGSRMKFSGGTDDAGLIDPSSTEPGFFTLPFIYYYSNRALSPAPPNYMGVYISHNDDIGLFKGITLTADDDEGGLSYELVQYPSDPNPSDGIHQSPLIVDAEKQDEQIVLYTPYHDFNFLSHIGVVHGDWVDAAKKYKKYRTSNADGKFSWLNANARPSGNPNN